MRDDRGGSTTLFALVGLPGAGKSTRARELETARGALRLSADEWMHPLFGASDPNGLRDVMEGRLIWTARRALRGGLDVVLDFGLWSRDERWAVRALAEEDGARTELVYLPVDAETQRRRIVSRYDDAPESTFAMSDAEIARSRVHFEEPTAEELGEGPIPPPPAGSRRWSDWAATRWPTSSAP